MVMGSSVVSDRNMIFVMLLSLNYIEISGIYVNSEICLNVLKFGLIICVVMCDSLSVVLSNSLFVVLIVNLYVLCVSDVDNVWLSVLFVVCVYVVYSMLVGLMSRLFFMRWVEVMVY